MPNELMLYRHFLVVAEELNFTRAAERLHVAQPALSRQVRTLERQLGVELLTRTTHSVTLTPVGADVRERIAAIVAEADALVAHTRAHAAGGRTTVVVGHTPSIAYQTAPTLIDAIGARLADLDVVGRMWSYDGVLDHVRDRTATIGLVRSGVDDEVLEVHPVRRLRQGVLVAGDDPLASATAVAVSALADRSILLHDRDLNPGHYDEIVGLCRSAGFEPTVLERSSAFDPDQAVVRRGEAVSIQADAAGDGRPNGLAWIPFEPEVRLELQLVVLPPPRPPAVDRVVDAALALSDELGWLVH